MSPRRLSWVSRGDSCLCSPYRILRTTRGFSVWLYTTAQSGRLAQELPTLEAAKAFAERHAEKERSMA